MRRHLPTSPTRATLRGGSCRARVTAAATRARRVLMGLATTAGKAPSIPIFPFSARAAPSAPTAPTAALASCRRRLRRRLQWSCSSQPGGRRRWLPLASRPLPPRCRRPRRRHPRSRLPRAQAPWSLTVAAPESRAWMIDHRLTRVPLLSCAGTEGGPRPERRQGAGIRTRPPPPWRRRSSSRSRGGAPRPAAPLERIATAAALSAVGHAPADDDET